MAALRKTLGRRRTQIAMMRAKGMRPAEIARELNICRSAVWKHLGIIRQIYPQVQWPAHKRGRHRRRYIDLEQLPGLN